MLIFLFAISFADVPKKYEVPKKLNYDDLRGGELYKELCWQCHGKTAQGDGPLSAQFAAPPLKGTVTVDNVDELVEIIQWGKGKMPAYEQLIDKHDTKRILKWLRCTNNESDKNNCDANRRKKNKSKNKAKTSTTKQDSSWGCSSLPSPMNGFLSVALTLGFLGMRRKR